MGLAHFPGLVALERADAGAVRPIAVRGDQPGLGRDHAAVAPADDEFGGGRPAGRDGRQGRGPHGAGRRADRGVPPRAGRQSDRRDLPLLSPRPAGGIDDAEQPGGDPAGGTASRRDRGACGRVAGRVRLRRRHGSRQAVRDRRERIRPRPPAAPAECRPGRRSWTTSSKGVVRSVAPESGRVLIRHQEIPGFMKAMTMPFEPADPSRSSGLLHPGDEVEGTLHVEKQDGAVRDYQLRDLKVTKAGPPRTLVVDVSKGKAQLREQPRAPGGGRAGPRLHDDRAGWQAAQALRPARQGGCTDVHLYTMSHAGFLPVDGSEVLGPGAAPERLPRSAPRTSG